MSAFPDRARVVIIGLGGIVGASVAHHLIERGWDDIVGIDKSGIPTDIGWTAHASGETYPVQVAGVGYKPLYDPENAKPRS
jgi:glycine/D-amino acid oxidase-like deaminating enzyme